MSLYGALAEHERQGKEVICGRDAFAANGQLAIDTPFATIDAVIATIESESAPTTQQISYDVDGNTVTLRAWEATAADNTALTASDAEESVSYVVVGRPYRG